MATSLILLQDGRVVDIGVHPFMVLQFEEWTPFSGTLDVIMDGIPLDEEYLSRPLTSSETMMLRAARGRVADEMRSRIERRQNKT